MAPDSSLSPALKKSKLSFPVLADCTAFTEPLRMIKSIKSLPQLTLIISPFSIRLASYFFELIKSYFLFLS